MSQPKYGDVLLKDGKAIFLGSTKLKNIWKYRKYRLVRWWLGTDVLTLWMKPPGFSRIRVVLHRVKAYLLNFLFEENWFVTEKLMNEVPVFLKLKNKKVEIHFCEDVKLKKNPLIVGYYMPDRKNKYNWWVYGGGTIEELKEYTKNQNIVFINYDGSYRVEDFLSVIDCYIRPSRHDGLPRILLLCQNHGIPFCYANNWQKMIDFIEYQYRWRYCAE